MLLKSEPDDGISDAFNNGLKICTGDWIIFLGAGDKFIHSTVLSDMAVELAKRPKSLVVWGNKTGVFVWSEPYYLIVIENQEIAKSNLTHFNYLWSIAEEPSKKDKEKRILT